MSTQLAIKPPTRKQWILSGAIIAAIIVFVIGLSACTNNDSDNESAVTVTMTAEPEPQVTVTAEPDYDVKIDVVQDLMREQSEFEEDEYVVGEVDASADTATAGPRAFHDENLRSGEDVVKFLRSGTPQAKTVLADIIKTTSFEGVVKDGKVIDEPIPTTKAHVLNPDNWVAVQFHVKVNWAGNTYYGGSGITRGEARVDDEGAVMLVFLPPDQVKSGKLWSFYALRGACTNPQPVLPEPVPEPEPECTSNCIPEKPVCKTNCIPVKPPCVEPSYAGKPGYISLGNCKWKKSEQSHDVMRDGGTAGAKPEVQDNSTSGVDVSSTKDGNGNVVTEPDPAVTHTDSAPDPDKDTTYTSGGGTGTSPGGETTDSSGTTTSTPTPPTPPEDSGQGGDNSGTVEMP